MADPPLRLQLTGCVVDLERRVARRGERTLKISPTEAALLGYLASRAGQVVSQEELHREVWKYKGTRGTKAAYFTWHRLRTKLEEDPDLPRHLLTVHGEGYQLLLGAEHKPDISTLSELPRAGLFDADTFVGRLSELGAIAEAFARGTRWIVLTGPPGIGKSRLARQFIGERAREGQTVVSVDLGERKGSLDLLGAIATGVGLSLRRTELSDASSRVVAALAALGKTWLFVDGAEGLARSGGGALARILSAAPDVRCLMTSRVAFQHAVAQRFEVGPMEAGDAAALFLARAEIRVGSWTPSPEEWEKVNAIALALEGLPLALEVAASQLGPLALEQVLERFREGPGRRAGLLDDVMEATLESAWTLLADKERRLFAAAAVFRGGFDAEAAAAVCGLGPDDAADALRTLWEHSLVRLERAEGSWRFDLFHVMRRFAEERGQELALHHEAAEHHATWFADLARDLEARSRRQDGWKAYARMRNEQANMEVALAHTTDPRRGLQIRLALARLFQHAAPLDTQRANAQAALRLAGATDDAALMARAGWVAAMAARDDGASRKDAGTMLQEVAAHAELADQHEVLGDARYQQAVLLFRRHLDDEAWPLLEAAHQAYERAGSKRGIGMTVGTYGMFATRRGDWASAEEHLLRSNRLLQEAGAEPERIVVLLNLGILLSNLGQITEAKAVLEECCQWARRYGDVERESSALSTLASFEEDPDAREALFDQAIANARRVGETRLYGLALFAAACAQAECGRYADAGRRLALAADVCARVGEWRETSMAFAAWGVMHAFLGHPDIARARIERAWAELGDRGGPERLALEIHSAIAASLEDPGATAPTLRALLARIPVPAPNVLRTPRHLAERLLEHRP